ncbi:MAG: dual specificity protein phosphatase family protein [Anaerolineae bacterium]|nr:dual specificity protein phosphatase family protein [Anaerolineae bacterium]
MSEISQAPQREITHSPLRMAWDWLTKRTPAVISLRVYDQLYRRLTGAPLERYSQITPHLHVGGQHWPQGLPALEGRGITAVINLRREFDDAAAGVGLSQYLHLPTEDNTAPTQETLRTGVDFIRQQVEQGGGVYIHCGVGVGRAPTLAAAYLVSTGLTPEQAWAQIRKVRPFIWPNRRQRASIREFAAGGTA